MVHKTPSHLSRLKIISANLLTLKNGDTYMQRIRRNLAFYALKLLVPDLAPAELGKSVIVLNLSREDIHSCLDSYQLEADEACGEHEPPKKNQYFTGTRIFLGNGISNEKSMFRHVEPPSVLGCGKRRIPEGMVRHQNNTEKYHT